MAGKQTVWDQVKTWLGWNGIGESRCFFLSMWSWSFKVGLVFD